MKARAFLLAALLLAASMVPAWADIDQLCLKQCVSGGGGSSGCLTQCSYGDMTPQGSLPKAAPDPPTHRVLHTPLPIDKAVMVGKKTASPKQPEKDYACFQACLQSVQAYGLCENRCTKPTCPAGEVLCENKPTMLDASSPDKLNPAAGSPQSQAR